MALDKDPFVSLEEERLLQAPPGIYRSAGRWRSPSTPGCSRQEGVSHDSPRFIKDAPEEGPWRDRGRMLGQGEFVRGEREARLQTPRQTVPHAEEQRIEQRRRGIMRGRR